MNIYIYKDTGASFGNIDFPEAAPSILSHVIGSSSSSQEKYGPPSFQSPR